MRNNNEVQEQQDIEDSNYRDRNRQSATICTQIQELPGTQRDEVKADTANTARRRVHL